MTVDLDRLAAALELLLERARGRRVALADVGGEDQDAPRSIGARSRHFVSASEAHRRGRGRDTPADVPPEPSLARDART